MVALLLEAVLGVLFLLIFGWIVGRSTTPDWLDQVFGAAAYIAISFVTIWSASNIFGLFGTRLSLIPILLLGAYFLTHDVKRVRVFLAAWHRELVMKGLDRPDLRPDEQDIETRGLYGDVGREIAYLSGRIIGYAIGTWWFL